MEIGCITKYSEETVRQLLTANRYNKNVCGNLTNKKILFFFFLRKFLYDKWTYIQGLIKT